MKEYLEIEYQRVLKRYVGKNTQKLNSREYIDVLQEKKYLEIKYDKILRHHIVKTTQTLSRREYVKIKYKRILKK